MKLSPEAILTIVVLLCLVSLLKLGAEDDFSEQERARVEVCK